GVGVFRGALCPRLKVLFGLPLRVDEVAVVAGDRAKQLESEEAGLIVDGVQSGGEPLLELGAGALGDLDRVDLHNSHAPRVLTRGDPRRNAGRRTGLSSPAERR